MTVRAVASTVRASCGMLEHVRVSLLHGRQPAQGHLRLLHGGSLHVCAWHTDGDDELTQRLCTGWPCWQALRHVQRTVEATFAAYVGLTPPRLFRGVMPTASGSQKDVVWVLDEEVQQHILRHGLVGAPLHIPDVHGAVALLHLVPTTESLHDQLPRNWRCPSASCGALLAAAATGVRPLLACVMGVTSHSLACLGACVSRLAARTSSAAPSTP